MIFLICPRAYCKPTVKVIYFKPVDVKMPSENKLNTLRESILITEKFYEREMEKYGYVSTTFLLKKNKNNEVVIHLVKGPKKLNEYIEVNTILKDVSEGLKLEGVKLERDPKDEIRIIFLGGSNSFRGGWVKANRCSENCFRFCIVPTELDKIQHYAVADVLGLAFGLEKSDDRKNIMFPHRQIGEGEASLKDLILSKEQAELLSNHNYFKDNPFFVDPIKKTFIIWAKLKL